MTNRQEEFKAILSQVLAPLQAELANLPTKAFIEETLERTEKAIEERFEEKLREERSKVESLEKRIEVLEARMCCFKSLNIRLRKWNSTAGRLIFDLITSTYQQETQRKIVWQ